MWLDLWDYSVIFININHFIYLGRTHTLTNISTMGQIKSKRQLEAARLLIGKMLSQCHFASLLIHVINVPASYTFRKIYLFRYWLLSFVLHYILNTAYTKKLSLINQGRKIVWREFDLNMIITMWECGDWINYHQEGVLLYNTEGFKSHNILKDGWMYQMIIKNDIFPISKWGCCKVKA